MNLFLTIFDVAIAVGLALRLARLVMSDDLGEWFVRWPVEKWAIIHEGGYDFHNMKSALDPRRGWRSKLVSGLTCPFCVGFWCVVFALATLAAVGGPGEAAHAWRWVAGAFALNYVTGHLGARLGDAGYDDE